MLTAVVGTSIVAVSAAQSGTTAQIKVSNGDFVLDMEDYYDTYDGTYGSFYVVGSIDETSIKVVNDTYATHKYYIEAMAYNHNAQRYDFVDYDVVTLGVYGNSFKRF